ncbi:hypothetical protein [Phytobacter diazotrophicus]|uniref:hypothetical protein n=1 Tax=Phytobacter diazotrophicus TaxID=395631 RepID=UPI0029360703|nr:hypothetical protein [Phytobacter diazotrophicus]MDV2874450.1 hypothetical protein [Phytobacter diazotrophicus]
MTIDSEQIQALKALYANVEKQAHALRGNPREYSVITGLCPVNVIEMQAQKIQALLVESAADKALIAESVVLFETLRQRIAELEARTLNVKLPEPPGPMSLGARAVYIGIVSDVVGAFQEACAAAGITLDVGE